MSFISSQCVKAPRFFAPLRAHSVRPRLFEVLLIQHKANPVPLLIIADKTRFYLCQRIAGIQTGFALLGFMHRF
ncbi:hypothetical protein QNH14_16735 [Apirhabdus apintestini]|nr:hypothetical protein QNH14_16735 [Enterobacteriaceae bacterium CA-0114]